MDDCDGHFVCCCHSFGEIYGPNGAGCAGGLLVLCIRAYFVCASAVLAQKMSLQKRHWWMAIARGVAHTTAVGLWFYAMARIPIADVTAMNYMSPIYVTIGAALFLKERLALRRLAAIAATQGRVWSVGGRVMAFISNPQSLPMTPTPWQSQSRKFLARFYRCWISRMRPM